MCQMCDEYEAELRRMGIEPEPADRKDRHAPPRVPAGPQEGAEPRQQEPNA
jgi:hypothetical protein